MVLPQLAQAEESETWDFSTILAQLSRVYDNPNKVQEAEDKLLSLRQGTDSIPAYISKFERVLYEAHGQDWPDINKISIFRNGLSSTVRNRLSQQLNLPSKYPDFIRIVQQLAGHSSGSTPTTLARSDSHSGNSHSYSQSRTPQVLQRSSDAMDLSTIGINAIDIGPAEVANAITIANIDLPQAPSITPELREQYRSEGQCVRCGSYDHWVGSCRLKPARKQTGKRIPASMDFSEVDPYAINVDSGSDSGWDTGAELERLQRGEI